MPVVAAGKQSSPRPGWCWEGPPEWWESTNPVGQGGFSLLWLPGEGRRRLHRAESRTQVPLGTSQPLPARLAAPPPPHFWAVSQWRWRGGQGAAAAAAGPAEQASRGSAEQAEMDVCSRARPNLLLAGGTGLASRGTGAGVFSPGEEQQRESWASTEFCVQHRAGGPWPCSCGVSALVEPNPVSGRAEGRVSGAPCPFLCLAPGMLCSLSSSRYQLRAGEPILGSLPASLSGRTPLPRVAKARVSAEPGGHGVIRDAPQGMHRGRDTGSNRACCYRQRLQLQRLPQPTGSSLPPGLPPFPAGFTVC